ncbi:conserved hypothetical protein [Ricinus communis]|uniref:Uncharacterized protein n=1 Tax=Ricinus communis TaxID=3988 RepID=B9TKM6_RICCO|nr:conserved hypothetical protein [Ricinus communis]
MIQDMFARTCPELRLRFAQPAHRVAGCASESGHHARTCALCRAVRTYPGARATEARHRARALRAVDHARPEERRLHAYAAGRLRA